MDKIQNLSDMEYYANMTLCLGLLKKWTDKSKSKDLQKFTTAIIDISFYTMKLQDELQKHKIAVSDYRERKNKALLQLQDIQEKYQALKKNIKFV